MYKTVVAIDIETTGIDPARDEILELGAAVLEGDNITDRFEVLVKPGRMPPPAIVNLTGITADMLQDARPMDEVAAGFLRFLEREDPVYIAHNASFERAFLQAATADAFSHRMLDTVGLSRILFPTLQSHALGFLAEALDLAPSRAHRALADCETTLALWRRIRDAALALPEAVVGEINDLLAPLRRHPYREFFQRVDRERFPRRFGRERRAYADLFASHRSLIESKPPARELDRPHGGPDPDEVAALFEPGGALDGSLSSYEAREGQVAMARSVAEALCGDEHLLVEAPTGIGKSLAYLVPAALFSVREKFPVILSTNTKNLQAQLFDKDIPLVEQALGTELRTALIKGRGNYLCLRKLLYLLDAADRELAREERIPLCVLVSWAARTETGDVAECVLTGRPDFGALWAKLRTIGDECLGRGCPMYGRCFLRRARALSLRADLVVANHALVFAELNMESAVLPEYRHVVFDEAHNLEAAATGHLTVEVSQSRAFQVLRRLYRRRRGRRGGTGLGPSVLAGLSSPEASLPDELADLCRKHCERMLAAVQAAEEHVAPFFDALAGTLPRRGPVSDRHRFAEARKRPRAWAPVDRAKQTLVSALAEVMRAAEAVAEALRETPAGGLAYRRDFQRELEAVIQWLRENVADIEFVLAGSEANYVYWVDRLPARQGGAAAYAAPLSIAELMHDQVYAKKMSCIFTSATLSVRDRFDFLAGRLGIDRIGRDRLRTLQAPSPFDFDRQCLVAVPAFLSEPDRRGSEDYIQGLSALLAQVYRRTRGRGLALFTSYHMLRETYRRLTEAMSGDGIVLLAQGESGSREHITGVFTRDVHSVLLGTHSFWEGVDVVGEALSCLTIARLPFAVHTEPIVQARCEQVEAAGRDAFLTYSVPSAVIRFKQGFGRLIRSRTDRGLVIIADRRVAVKRYGRMFLDSLPAEAEIFGDRQEFLDAVEDFFGEDG